MHALYVWLLLDHGAYEDASGYSFVGPFDAADVAAEWAEARTNHFTDWQLVRGDPQQPRVLSIDDANEVYDLGEGDDAD